MNSDFIDGPKYAAAIAQLVKSDFIKKGQFNDVTEFQVADGMIMADRMLWYFQLKKWVEEKWLINEIADDGGTKIQEGAEALLQIIDHGYDEDWGWWNRMVLSRDEVELAQITIKIWAFGHFVRLAREKTNQLISPWFDIAIAVVTQPDWIKQSEKYAKRSKFLSEKESDT
jgi:hypothetical protein